MLLTMGLIVKSPISRVLFAISVLTLTAVTGSTAGANDARRQPSVAVTREQPVIVAGRAFLARERIALRVVIGSRAFSRSLRATATGTFRATFAAADATCHPYAVTARGAAGSRASQTRRFNIPPPCGMDPQP
jgi:hypothetical protein